MLKFLRNLLIFLFIFIVIIDIGVGVYAEIDEGQFIGPLLKNVVYSYQQPLTNSSVKEMKELLGGTALGVCHPEDDPYNVSLLGEANIGWVRFDISNLPYEIHADGTPVLGDDGKPVETASYKAFKARCKIYQDKGIRVMAVTPYIDDMLSDLDAAAAREGISTSHIDVFNNGGEFPKEFDTLIKGISEYYARDLAGENAEGYRYVSAFQISNELTVEKWMGALTKEQVVYYMGELQMKTMYDICRANGTPTGYNTQGGDLVELPYMMVEYEDYYDFVGLDLYLGCFEDLYKTNFIYELLVRHLYNISKKPIFIQEFGYISTGTPKNEQQQADYLAQTFPSHPTVEAIIADPIGFLDAWEALIDEESPLIREARRKYDAALANGGSEAEAKFEAAGYIFQSGEIAHLYKALPEGYELSDYAHTEEGQAAFFTDTVAMLSRLDCVCGIFVYMYNDSKECYQCGQEGCPVETGWGLVTLDDSETEFGEHNVYKKASFYAIKDAFGKIKAADEAKYKK